MNYSSEVFNSVWDDLEDDHVEKENLKIRSKLMMNVKDWYISTGLTQAEAAKVLRVTRPKLNNVLNGHIHMFTIDRLINMLACAGKHVQVNVN